MNKTCTIWPEGTSFRKYAVGWMLRNITKGLRLHPTFVLTQRQGLIASRRTRVEKEGISVHCA